MVGLSGADDFVVGGSGIASGVSGDNFIDARELLEDGFGTPEAAACEYGSLPALRGGAIRIDSGIGERSRRFRRGKQ
jgi:hypothetical protein